MKRHWALSAVVVVLFTACGGDDDPAATTTEADIVVTTAATGASTVTTTEVTPPPVTTLTLPDPGAGLEWRDDLRVPEVLSDFEMGSVWLDEVQLAVAVADTSVLRQQGLMNVANLGDLDGMVFIFEQNSSGGFWMKDTILPLDIAFFEHGGAFVDGFRMEPCVTEECPSYTPSGPYRYALEMVAGTMPETPGTLILEVPE